MTTTTTSEGPAPGVTATPASARRSSKRRAELTERIFELRTVFKKLFGASVYREMCDVHSVTIHQLTALGYLKSGSVTMRELARDLDVSESSATAVTDRLVRQGLVERRDDPADRRVVRLALSPEGTALVDRLAIEAAAKTSEMLSVLSDSQLEQLVDIVETLERTHPNDHPARHGAQP